MLTCIIHYTTPIFSRKSTSRFVGSLVGQSVCWLVGLSVGSSLITRNTHIIAISLVFSYGALCKYFMSAATGALSCSQPQLGGVVLHGQGETRQLRNAFAF